MHPFLKSHRLFIYLKSHLNVKKKKFTVWCIEVQKWSFSKITIKSWVFAWFCIALVIIALWMIYTRVSCLFMLMCMYGRGGFALSSYITLISRTANQRSVFPLLFFLMNIQTKRCYCTLYNSERKCRQSVWRLKSWHNPNWNICPHSSRKLSAFSSHQVLPLSCVFLTVHGSPPTCVRWDPEGLLEEINSRCYE